MPVSEKQTVRFGPFEFDPQSGELFKNSHKLKLEGQPLQVLAILLEKPGTLVTRDEISKRLWPADTFVDSERILNADVWKLRQALGDSAEKPRYVETLPKRGYRFVWEQPALEAAPGPVLVDSIAPAEKPKTSRKLIVLIMLAAAAMVSAASWYGRPLNPRIVGTHRLTYDAVQKSDLPGWCSLATDGVRIYFYEHRTTGDWVLSQVSTHGGEVSEVRSPLKGHQCIQDLSRDGSELLVNVLTPEGWKPWGIALPSGTSRKIPVSDKDDYGPYGPWSSWLWTRDKSGVFYTSNRRDFKHLDLATGIDTHLFSAEDIAYPRLSPDAKTVRFSSIFGGTEERPKEQSIWEASIDGRSLHPLFPDPAYRFFFGNWSSEGSLFFLYKQQGPSLSLWVLPEHTAWSRFMKAKPTLLYPGPLELRAAIPAKDGKRLYAVGADERAELFVYDTSRQRLEPFLSGINACYVDFSPDGKWITYVTYPDGNLWRSRIDGSEKLQLTFPPTGVLLPRWSPDGKSIVFMDWYSGSEHKTYLISRDGGSPHLLLSGDFSADPTWSPDGNSIAYGCFGCAAGEVRIYDLRSTTSRVIPGSVGVWSPRWSPNGRFIVAKALNQTDLMLFDFTRKKWKLLAKLPFVSFPSWSHDSRYVYAKAINPTEIDRIDVESGRIERVASLEGILLTAFRFPRNGWFGLTPDDRILILRDTGSEDIYALDLEY